MFFKNGTTETIERPNMREGKGTCYMRQLCDAQAMPKNCTVYAELTVPKGCSVGQHAHEGNTEFYYCISGKGIFNDDGREVEFNPGDSGVTGKGATHGVYNPYDEPLVILAVVYND